MNEKAMTKKNATEKIKSVSWIKLPVRLMDDGRVRKLFLEKGTLGVGVYVIILLELYRNSWQCLSEKNIKTLKLVGATQKTISTVLEDYDLFQKDRHGNWKLKKNLLEYQYNDEELIGGGIDEEKQEDYRSNHKSDDRPDNKPYLQSDYKSDSKPRRARNIETETETDYHHLDGDDAKAVVRSDGDFISKIPRQSEWTEVALMRSRFGPLIARNWEVAMEAFRRHVIANCRESDIRSVDDAKRYFLYYVTNPVTGPLLRQTLEEHERRHPGLNAYRHEDPGSKPGNRRYNGMPLPDDAPPRPTARSDWDYTNGGWISVE